MDTTTLIRIGALILGLACFVYIFVGAQRLYRSREARVNATPAQADAATAAPSGEAPPPAELPSPFVAAPEGPADDLTRIKGIGPKLSARLAELGVFHYSQIAGWTPEQLAAVDAQLGSFQGRPQRDQWQSQAQLLASGDVKAYERAHGKLERPAGGPQGPLDQSTAGPGA